MKRHAITNQEQGAACGRQGPGETLTTNMPDVTCHHCWAFHLQDCITDGILAIEDAQKMYRAYTIPESWEYIERKIKEDVE